MDTERDVVVTVRAAFNQDHLCMQYKLFASTGKLNVNTELIGSETFDTPVSVALLPDWVADDLLLLMMRKNHIPGIGEWYNNIDIYEHGDATHRAWVGPKIITYLHLQELSRRALWHYASVYKRLTDQQRYERLTNTTKDSD